MMFILVTFVKHLLRDTICLSHRKRDHKDRVKECRYFKEGKCELDGDTCWFIHEKDHDNKLFAKDCKYDPACRKNKNNQCRFKHKLDFHNVNRISKVF